MLARKQRGVMNEMKLGFELQKVLLPLSAILPVKQIKDPHKSIRRFGTILASIREVGLIEPLVVYPQKDSGGKYLLLDGHLRVLALKELNQHEAECIVSIDDECFT